jgi:hypothetical protein
MHVPKTSGVAITDGLARALTKPFGRRLTKAIYGRHQILTGFDRSLHGGFDRFDTFDASVRARFHPEALPTGWRVISGHFAYSTLKRSAPAAHIFTILRDPFCRLCLIGSTGDTSPRRSFHRMVCGPIARAKRDVPLSIFCVHRLWPVRQITSW